MDPRDQETEAKFYILRPERLQTRLLEAGGHVQTARTHEYNCRFDTPGRDLEHNGRLLRLRRDLRTILTYKDNTQIEGGALRRREIELEVDDFDKCLRFLQALGYEVVFTYEKFRTTYSLGSCEVMLDELPYGHFAEIEGDRNEIESLASILGLNWERAIPRSYHALFVALRDRQPAVGQDLTFDNFAGRAIGANDLGVDAADG